jgi:hypothetical protein
MYFSLQVNLNLIKMYTVAIYLWVVSIDRNSLFLTLTTVDLQMTQTKLHCTVDATQTAWIEPNFITDVIWTAQI